MRRKPGAGRETRDVREVAKDIYALVGKRKAKQLEKLLKELAASLIEDRHGEEGSD